MISNLHDFSSLCSYKTISSPKKVVVVGGLCVQQSEWSSINLPGHTTSVTQHFF